MPRIRPAKAAIERREKLLAEHWPAAVPWLGPDEVGYFAAPRTLPYVLRALSAKAVSGNLDPSSVYLDLLSRHLGQGVVELTYEEDHAFAAGYRSARTWQDRMNVLEKAGFIQASTTGNRKYAKVLLVHPTIAMQRLRDQGLIADDLWNAYRNRAIDAKEPPLADIAGRNHSDTNTEGLTLSGTASSSDGQTAGGAEGSGSQSASS